MSGLLLAAGAVTFSAWASPISPGSAPSVRLEGAAASDFDKRLTPVWEATQEVRRTGPGISPSLLGIDEGVLSQASLLHSEVREESVEQALGAGRPGSVRNVNGDMFSEAISSALRATRDAFFEGSDTASFSLAGVELSVTLRGDRRGISLNGYDVVGTNPFTDEEAGPYKVAESPIIPASQETFVRQVDGAIVLPITIADLRRFVSDPTTILSGLAVLGIWVVIGMVSRARGS